MGKHVADQPRDRGEGTRTREYTRIERSQGAEGPHPTTEELQRRASGSPAEGKRTEEFLRRERRNET